MDEINNQEQVQDVEETEIKDTQQNEEIVEEKTYSKDSFPPCLHPNLGF